MYIIQKSNESETRNDVHRSLYNTTQFNLRVSILTHAQAHVCTQLTCVTSSAQTKHSFILWSICTNLRLHFIFTTKNY